MNLIKLLTESRKLINHCIGKFPMGEVELYEAEKLRDKIDEFLAKPAPDAMEIVDRIRDAVIQEPCEGVQQIGYILTNEKAAALIESYGKREERATDLLKIIVSSETRKINQDPYPCGHRACKFVRIAQDILAAKHSYKVEG